MIIVYWTPSMSPRPSSTPRRTGRAQSWRLGAWIVESCRFVGSIHSITPHQTLPRCPPGSRARHQWYYRLARYRPSSSLWAGRSAVGENALPSGSSSHLRFGAFSRPDVDRAPLPAAPAPRRLRCAHGQRRRSRASSVSPEDTSFVHQTAVIMGSSLGS